MNAYPELPLLNYEPTTVPMDDVIAYLDGQDIPREIKRAVYIIFRQESSDGSHGINHNYAGAMADGTRWSSLFDDILAGVVEKKDAKTGKLRLYLAFYNWESCLDFLVSRISSRGIFIGGYARLVAKMEVDTPDHLATAYFRDWVAGDADYKLTAGEKAGFLAMYKDAVAHFS
ncbi:hypothetical protein GA0116948_101173 [Chitinophaga costaii]|uniref:Uncharacterized protein n=1 Tax=Chitinophaga costaii TaxID=1335309 RepID=A0A1C3YZ58_9BACT|nr:hypothetical protein [Chitinophaga costaii]PUZ30169.1 hypothetical protein DCM91_01460 [Chitinophaga costaii]SCB75437.1 hypothetical protein GA0116948_101173 [Chitinophaga costaii]